MVDFGSQFTQLIARRVREAGVYSEIVPFSGAEAALERMQPKGVILSGSPASVPASGSPRAPQAIFDRSEEHTSELQSLMRTSYAVSCLKKNNSELLTATVRSHHPAANTRDYRPSDATY